MREQYQYSLFQELLRIKKSYNVNFQRLISFEFSFFMDHFFVEYLLNVLNSA
jgi:hypothetical protein